MTIFVGYDALKGRGSGHLPGVSPNLDSSSTPARVFEGLLFLHQINYGFDADGHWQHVVDFVHWDEVGHFGFINNIWDKIHVTPTKRDFATIFSQRNFTIEVWNTYRNSAKILTSIVPSGTGNIVIMNPLGLPLIYQPSSSNVYQASLPGNGDPTINNLVNFIFTGLKPVNYTALGSRVMVFWPQMDWSEPFKESLEFLTDVLPAYAGNEQRRRLRSLPRYLVSYRVLTLEKHTTVLLENQLFYGQGTLWGVPWWTEVSPLLSFGNIGDTSLLVDTTYRPSFEVNGLIMLWSDPFTWEVLPVTQITDSSISIGIPLTKNWSARTKVVPMRKGFMSNNIPLARPVNWLTATTFSFSCEAVS